MGLAQLGLAQLGQYLIPSVGVTGSFVGQGVLTDTQVFVITGSFVGQGIFEQFLPITGNFTGQGVFYQFFSCPRDSTVILYLIPQATVAVVMPIAYISGVFDYNDIPNCSPSTATIPITGSLSTLVEGNDGEALDNV